MPTLNDINEFAWKQYTISMSNQLMVDHSPAMNHLIDTMLREAALDLRDGPRLGPGRHELYRIERSKRIRALVPGTPGRFIRA